MNFPFSNNFYKIWGVIKKDLMAGNYTILINNTYIVQMEFSKKNIYLTNGYILGGKNKFVYIICFVGGVLMVIIGILFYFFNRYT